MALYTRWPARGRGGEYPIGRASPALTNLECTADARSAVGEDKIPTIRGSIAPEKDLPQEIVEGERDRSCFFFFVGFVKGIICGPRSNRMPPKTYIKQPRGTLFCQDSLGCLRMMEVEAAGVLLRRLYHGPSWPRMIGTGWGPQGRSWRSASLSLLFAYPSDDDLTQFRFVASQYLTLPIPHA